ncbi:MAG: lamin tail domain-containing protein, partial [Planctomycetales bacterium]|nr:lamin tail domain-containing protein [Planctomycetales bacterium]
MKFESLEPRWLLAGDTVMYNDHVAGPATHPFTTSYAAIGNASGLLRDSATGDDTTITLTTSASGVSFESVAGSPAPGTDAYDLFNDWVDFGSGGGASIAVSGSSNSYSHTFTGLDPDTIYDFAGAAVRGNTGYTNRWTLVTLVGAESFTPAHSSGAGVVTSGLAANQVAIWTGENHLASQGFVAAWDEIDPGSDGAFQIISQQYLGLTPGVGTGSAATGSKGYGLAAIRLVERESNVLRVESTDPSNGAALTSLPTTYLVNLNTPFDVATVGAGDLTIDGMPATAVQIVDADTLEFTLPPLGAGPLHNVSIAAGSIASSVGSLPIESFDATFTLLSGSGVVINEVSYDPGDGSLPLEFVELFNVGPSAVDLSGWSLDDAVSFTIPSNTILASGEYLIVSQDPTEFANFYGLASIGPFSGRLSNDGETIVLRDAQGVVQDEVDYQLGFPWPTIGDIPGESIQLVNPTFENDLGGNWRSAAATPGAVNSVFALNSPPQMRQVSHSPNAPVSGQDVTITMRITDPQGVAAATLEYQLVEPGDYIEIIDPRYATNWTSIAMRDDGLAGDAVAGDDVYTAILPGNLQTHRRLVRYRVTAEDTLGASVTAPYADDPQPNFAYFVYDATPDWTGAARPGVTPGVTYDGELLDSIATYHLITTRQDHEQSQYIPNSNQGPYGGSDYLWHGALVYDGVVYDHIHFRSRGGVWRYAMGKNMWK